jgi:hypothetical protein
MFRKNFRTLLGYTIKRQSFNKGKRRISKAKGTKWKYQTTGY